MIGFRLDPKKIPAGAAENLSVQLPRQPCECRLVLSRIQVQLEENYINEGRIFVAQG